MARLTSKIVQILPITPDISYKMTHKHSSKSCIVLCENGSVFINPRAITSMDHSDWEPLFEQNSRATPDTVPLVGGPAQHPKFAEMQGIYLFVFENRNGEYYKEYVDQDTLNTVSSFITGTGWHKYSFINSQYVYQGKALWCGATKSIEYAKQLSKQKYKGI